MGSPASNSEAVPPGYHAAAAIEPGDLASASGSMEDFARAPREPGALDAERARARAATAVRLVHASSPSGRLAELRADGSLSAEELKIAADYVGEGFRREHRRRARGEVPAALRALGADPATVLSASERESLSRDGYLNLGVLLDPELLSLLRDRFDAMVAAEGSAAGHETSQTVGIARLSATVLKPLNDDGLLDRFYCHPRLLAAVAHVLGDDFVLSSSNFHAPLPGGWGHQGLHADTLGGVPEGEWEVCNAIWCAARLCHHACLSSASIIAQIKSQNSRTTNEMHIHRWVTRSADVQNQRRDQRCAICDV